jgi:ferredoxin
VRQAQIRTLKKVREGNKMVVKTVRNIIKIDEEKCNGCGACAIKCAEGAIKIIDGRAKLISETYCDGLGACIGECPEGALTIEERPATEFDEEAVQHHLEKPARKAPVACSCPSAAVAEFQREEAPAGSSRVSNRPSALRHWPVQLTLVPPTAPFLKGADLLLTAQCVPLAYAGFHEDFLKGHRVLIACPKLDDLQAHLEKLTDILSQSDVKSLTVVHMEVPCCSGLVYMAKEALRLSGKDIPFDEVTIGIRGDRKA